MNRNDRWLAGQEAIFRYGLAPDPDSDISARLAHRSGETVEVLGESASDADFDAYPTLQDRMNAGCLAVYLVRFDDGHEDIAFEDELFSTVETA